MTKSKPTIDENGRSPLPDQVLEFLREHRFGSSLKEHLMLYSMVEGKDECLEVMGNFSEAELSSEDAIELVEWIKGRTDGLTYDGPCHPNLKTDRLNRTLRNSIDNFTGVEGTSRYFDFRENKEPLPKIGGRQPEIRTIKRAMDTGPYGHAKVGSTAMGGGLLDFGDYKSTSSFSKLTDSSWLMTNILGQNMISQIDLGYMENEEFDRDWTKATKAMMESYPLVLTLFARNPEFPVSRLDRIVDDASNGLVVDSEELSKIDEMCLGLNNTLRYSKDHNIVDELTPEVMGRVGRFLSDYRNAREAVSEFLEREVKYEEGK